MPKHIDLHKKQSKWGGRPLSTSWANFEQISTNFEQIKNHNDKCRMADNLELPEEAAYNEKTENTLQKCQEKLAQLAYLFKVKKNLVQYLRMMLHAQEWTLMPFFFFNLCLSF